MRKKISLIILSLLLCSCSSLRKAKQVNEAYFVRHELAKVLSDLEQAEPAGLPMRTLYLVDLSGSHSETLETLASKAKEGSADGLLIAQLRGDGEYLIKWSDDPLLVAQGYLLIGNWVEAKRMNLHDSATEAMVYLAEQDTLRAIKSLEHLIVQKDVDRMIRLNGTRQLCELVPDSYLGLKQMMMLTANSWEQFVAKTLLDYYAGSEMRYDPRNSREELFVKMLEAKRSGDANSLKDVTHRIMHDKSELRQNERLMRDLRKNLLREELYPEALEVHKTLPESAKREYPYALLEEYEDDISFMKSYERAETANSIVRPIKANPQPHSVDGSFRTRWGSVRNIDNWAMEYSSIYDAQEDRQLQKPTKEQYERIRNHLKTQIPRP